MSVTPTPTPSYDICIDVTGQVEMRDVPVSSTPSPTPTITPSINRDRVINSGITFVIDYGYFECSDVAKIIDCDNNEIYYVNTPLFFNNVEIEQDKIIKCSINGVSRCVTYNENVNGSSTHFISNILSIHDTCGECLPTPTPTATNTSTPTPTPTITPSQTPPRINSSYVYTGCGTNQMVIQTDSVPSINEGQVFEYNNQCWYYVGVFNNPYYPPSGFIITNYNYNYFGTINSGDIYTNCSLCIGTAV